MGCRPVPDTQQKIDGRRPRGRVRLYAESRSISPCDDFERVT
jgi:hypothetical protein